MNQKLYATIQAMIDDLNNNITPKADATAFPCFNEMALQGNPDITPAMLDAVLATLTPADIPTLQRALIAIENKEQAWLGFKIVTDPCVVRNSEDTEVVGVKGKGAGSADDQHGIFFATEDKEIVFSRPYSNRDSFQMLDITRGPQMHNEQYAGVAWLSESLEPASRVFILGAGTVGSCVEKTAHDVGFATVAVDYDSEYLNEQRFPLSKRVLISSFTDIPDLGITEDDYVLVLTRGHMYDPEALIFGVVSQAGYVGMMGCLEKNQRVFDMIEAAGTPRATLEATHTPIGLRFGAKTPPELAISIVAELIQVRHDKRKQRQQ
ncbi:MAG: XdhC/CoxF family protein [Coriobacteriaceae bacterium]|nr:XdhC/CoxF family protein [Coriobacteriaceae bacterium]